MEHGLQAMRKVCKPLISLVLMPYWHTLL